jgi:hypothetical protein
VIAVPNRSCSLQFDGNVRLRWRDVGLVELHRCTGKRRGCIPAFTLHAHLGPVTRSDDLRIFVGCELEFDVRFLFRVANDNRVRRGFGALESVRDGERDVLTIITNDIVFERRPPFYADAFVALPSARTENFTDVFAMEDRAHAGHLFCRGRVEFGDSAIGDCGLDRHGIQQSGKVEVGGVAGGAADLQWAIDARSIATDR